MSVEEKWGGVLKALPFLEHAVDGEQVYGYLRNLDRENHKLMFNCIRYENLLEKIYMIATTTNKGDLDHFRGQIDAIILVSKQSGEKKNGNT